MSLKNWWLLILVLTDDADVMGNLLLLLSKLTEKDLQNIATALRRKGYLTGLLHFGHAAEALEITLLNREKVVAALREAARSPRYNPLGDCRQRQFGSRSHRVGLGCGAMVRPASPIMPRRPPKPDRRRALELLAACPDGCTEAILLAYGFTLELLIELCIAELAIATPQRMVIGGARLRSCE